MSIRSSKFLLLAASATLLAACGQSSTPDAAPSVTLSLSSTTVMAPGSVTLTATATDDKGVTKVEFYDNDQKVGEDDSTPYVLTRSYVGSDQGAHVLRAVATDTAGQTAQDSKTLTVAPVPTVQVSGVVSQQRAGVAVAGATVSAEGSSAVATTDAGGRYSMAVPITTKSLLITKNGYAATRVENLDASAPLVIDEILQQSFDPSLPSVPPTVTTDLQDGATIGGGDLNVKVKTVTASPTFNGPTIGIVSVGTEAGNSGFLNTGRTRSAQLALTGDDTFTFKASDLAAFSGNVDVHIDIYDYNGNRTHLIRHVKAVTAAQSTAVVAPTALAPVAITFAQDSTFGPLSTRPELDAALQQWASSGGRNVAALKTLATQVRAAKSTANALTPQAADTGTVMWVDVNFSYDPAAPAPRSFDLYRSLDGQTYSKVLSNLPGKLLIDSTKPNSGKYVMRDNSAQLTPGVQTYYKVRAVSDSGGQDSAVTTVTPLGRYTISLGAPAQAATGVETQPIFRWSTGGASDKELLTLVLEDRTQAEGKDAQWQSDVSGLTSAVYDFDGYAATPYLQPFHAYDWQLAGATYNTAQTAFSIGADFFNVLGLTAFPVESDPINEFVTGGY